MKNLLTVMGFTIKDMIKRKSFLISTIIILVMIVIGFNIPKLIKTVQGGTAESKLLIVDSENVYEGTLESLNSMNLGYKFEISNEKIGFEDVKKKIQNNEVAESIIIEKAENQFKIRYIVRSESAYTSVPEKCVNALNSLYTNLQISKLGLSQSQLETINPKFDFSLEQIEEQKASGNVFAIMLLSIVLFYAIYFCAYQVSSSITTEKTSKIMETLVTSTKPSIIVIGKTIGIGIVGLVQVSIMVVVAVISANLFLEPGMIDQILDLSKITPFLAVVTIIYFMLGYFAYAFLYALTGSTVSKPEDIQSANTPVALISVLSFYLSYFTMMDPTSDLNVFAAIFPLSSPFCMPFRVMMGLSNTTDVIISLAVLLITIFVISKVAIRIYSNAILNYGTKLSFKSIIKMYKDKNN